jgi:hypothetical protein
MLLSGADVAATRNVRIQRTLLMIATGVETLAGVGLVIVPDATMQILFGGRPDSVGMMMGRVAGLALLALALACWGARSDAGGEARAATVGAITLYNAAGGILLVLFAATGQANGLGVWSAALCHLALAAGFLASRRRPGSQEVR